MGLGGLWWSSVLDLALPPRRLRPNTQPEHEDPASHMAQKKSAKKQKQKNRQNPRTDGKSNLIQTKSHKEAYAYTLTKREKGKKYIYRCS